VHRRIPIESAPEVLSKPVAERLLERASELDAALRGTLAVSELRLAATEAGISPQAFDAALAELRREEGAPAPNVTAQPVRRWRWAWAAGAAALVAVGSLGIARAFPSDAAGAPMIEKAFLLRCLSAGQAAALIRPVFDLPTNTVESSPAAPGVLTVRATSSQLEKVRSVLDPYEGAGSPACARTPPPTIR